MISGNNFIFYFIQREILFLATLFLLIVFLNKKNILDRRTFLFYFIFSIITLVHYYKFGNSIIISTLGFFVTLTIGLLITKKISNFKDIYVKIIYYISLTSLFFYFSYLIFGIKIGIELNYINTHNFLFNYNIGNHDSIFRNSGMFWEPGAFAGYIALGLLFALRSFNSIKTFRKEIFILFFTLTTTFSTMGYATLSLLIFLYFVNLKKITISDQKLIPSLILFLIIISFYYIIFFHFDFLGSKIVSQYEQTLLRSDNYESTRFGNFIYDLEFIKKNPFFGLSANTEIRTIYDANAYDLIKTQGNSLSGFTVRFGIIGIITILVYFYLNAYCETKSKFISLIYLLIFMILLTGEKFLNFPLIFILIFMNNKKLKNI